MPSRKRATTVSTSSFVKSPVNLNNPLCSIPKQELSRLRLTLLLTLLVCVLTLLTEWRFVFLLRNYVCRLVCQKVRKEVGKQVFFFWRTWGNLSSHFIELSSRETKTQTLSKSLFVVSSSNLHKSGWLLVVSSYCHISTGTNKYLHLMGFPDRESHAALIATQHNGFSKLTFLVVFWEMSEKEVHMEGRFGGMQRSALVIFIDWLCNNWHADYMHFRDWNNILELQMDSRCWCR